MKHQYRYKSAPKACPSCDNTTISAVRWEKKSTYYKCAKCTRGWSVLNKEVAKQRQHREAKTLDAVKSSFSTFQLSLFEKYAKHDRFRFNSMFGDYDDNVGYCLSEEFIHITYNFPTLAHQIAHFVEMQDESRWVKPDWGLTNFATPRNNQVTATGLAVALARETRVRAIHTYMGDPYVSLMKNSVWAGMVEDRLPFLRFNTIDEVEEWLQHISDTTKKTWSLDRIESAWHTRVEYVLNWMAK